MQLEKLKDITENLFCQDFTLQTEQFDGSDKIPFFMWSYPD